MAGTKPSEPRKVGSSKSRGERAGYRGNQAKGNEQTTHDDPFDSADSFPRMVDHE